MRVNVGVFSNVNQKMLDDVQADVDQNEADADAAIAIKADQGWSYLQIVLLQLKIT